MALFFDLEKLENSAKSNPTVLITLLKYHYNGKTIPKNTSEKIKPINLAGKSFILNPAPLFNLTIEPALLSQYILLAGRRDYSMYKLHGVKYLDLSYYPDLVLDNLKYNPLLKIELNKLNFFYEENYGYKVQKYQW